MAKTRLLPVALVVLLLSGCGNSARIHLPPPTGDRTNDLAVVADAFERVEPGGTIVFAAGSYLIGSEGVVLRTPGVKLQGHPDGTTLLGCTVEERADPGMGYFWEVCDGLILGAEAPRVSGLRFDGFSAALTIEEPSAEGEPPGSAGSDRASAFIGGHVIEGNTFQDVHCRRVCP